MKRRILALVMLLVLTVSALPSLAETWYVYTANGKTLNLRDENTNAVIGHIPFGTALEPDSSKSTEKAAYVTYNGKSGFVQWSFLQKEKPKAYSGKATATPKSNKKAKATPTPTPKPDVRGVEYKSKDPSSYYDLERKDNEFELIVLGGYMQFANSKNRGEGAKWETLLVTEKDGVMITADVPKNDKIDYWVINGVRYDFQNTVKTLRVKNVDQDFTFEIVYKKQDSATLISESEIQASRTGEQLVLKTVKARFYHIDSKGKSGGEKMESFDFTEDYVNKATKKKEKGGQVSARVQAVIPSHRKVVGWKFDNTELYPNSTVERFLVHTQNASITYEPLFAVEKTPTPSPVPVTYYNVKCIRCTFSGGGYSGATSGKVPSGTHITIRSIYGGGTTVDWEVNGSMKYNQDAGNSIYKTITQDTEIICYMQIN